MLRRFVGTLYWDVAAAFCRGRSPEVERIAGRVAMQKVFSDLENENLERFARPPALIRRREMP